MNKLGIRGMAIILASMSWVACLAQDAPDPELLVMLRHAAGVEYGFEDRFDAHVWLTDMSQRMRKRIPDTAQRLDLLKTVHQEATRAGLLPELVLAVIHVESNFDRYAISNVGARGLMQIMPFWQREIGRGEDNLFEIPTNLRYGCTILRHYLRKENGDVKRALARYNGSLHSNKYPSRVFGTLRKFWYKQ